MKTNFGREVQNDYGIFLTYPRVVPVQELYAFGVVSSKGGDEETYDFPRDQFETSYGSAKL
jgi:hypothetical protein